MSSGHPRPHRRTAGHAALFACLLALLVPAASARAETTWEITGGGWGHGIGMSQWGAFGYAKKGKSWKFILRHYYTHTKIGGASSKKIRVLLESGSDSVGFTDATRACGRDLDEGKTYTAVRDGSGVHLRSADGQDLGGCGDSLQATGGEAIRVIDEGAYRGTLVVVPRGDGGLYVVNKVTLEGYVQGVVPNEMPSEWPAQALRAQAVAARSYGLATGVSGAPFDQYDDTRSQVYGGFSSETANTNQAAKATAGKVVKYGGKVATTFYFSTSGGRTENIEHVFIGSDPKPYLKSVKDPFEDASPYHRWKQTFSQAEMESKLGDLVDGSLQAIEVTKRGNSPRIVSAKVVGSGGTTEVSGPTLQARLGLRSTWAYFDKTGS